MLAVLAGTLVVSACAAQHQALLERKLQIGRLAALRLVAQVTGGAVAILAAWALQSVWALIVQQYVELVVLALLAWWWEPWRPCAWRRGESARELLRFGGFYASSGLLFFLAQNVDKILLGWLLGATQAGHAAVGFYSQAFNLMMKPVYVVASPITGIMLPALSRTAHQPTRFTPLVARFFRMVGILLFPCGVGLCVVALDVVLVLGARLARCWAAADDPGPGDLDPRSDQYLWQCVCRHRAGPRAGGRRRRHGALDGGLLRHWPGAGTRVLALTGRTYLGCRRRLCGRDLAGRTALLALLLPDGPGGPRRRAGSLAARLPWPPWPWAWSLRRPVRRRTSWRWGPYSAWRSWLAWGSRPICSWRAGTGLAVEPVAPCATRAVRLALWSDVQSPWENLTPRHRWFSVQVAEQQAPASSRISIRMGVSKGITPGSSVRGRLIGDEWRSAMSIQSRTSTVTINAAFLQEIKDVNEDLWKLFEEVKRLCGDPLTVQHQGRVVAESLAELRDQLGMHFALEEAYGYFNDPVHVAPQLNEAAAMLRDEHRELYAAMRDLADEVDELYRSGRIANSGPRVVEQFRAYYDRFQRHENRENELILDAYDSDLGVGD